MSARRHASRDDIRQRVARDRGAPARRSASPTPGTSRRSTARCTTSRAAYPFDPESEDYLVHITTGTHVVQICLFLLTESRHIPGAPAADARRRRSAASEPGRFAIIDLDLSKYDRLASRFARDERDERSLLKSGIETRNAASTALIERIEHVAVALARAACC